MKIRCSSPARLLSLFLLVTLLCTNNGMGYAGAADTPALRQPLFAGEGAALENTAAGSQLSGDEQPGLGDKPEDLSGGELTDTFTYRGSSDTPALFYDPPAMDKVYHGSPVVAPEIPAAFEYSKSYVYPYWYYAAEDGSRGDQIAGAPSERGNYIYQAAIWDGSACRYISIWFSITDCYPGALDSGPITRQLYIYEHDGEGEYVSTFDIQDCWAALSCGRCKTRGLAMFRFAGADNTGIKTDPAEEATSGADTRLTLEVPAQTAAGGGPSGVAVGRRAAEQALLGADNPTVLEIAALSGGGPDELEKGFQVTLDAGVLEAISKAGVEELILNTAAGAMTLRAGSLAALAAAGEAVAVSMRSLGAESLREEDAGSEYLAAIEIDVAVGPRSTDTGDFTRHIREFPDVLTVTFPLAAAAGSDPNGYVVYCLGSAGRQVMPYSVYDGASGTVILNTTHLSTCAVACNKQQYDDVAAGSWYADAIRFLSARNIMQGMGRNTFAPERPLSRAEFTLILACWAGVDLIKTAYVDAFQDVGESAWYAKTVSWAYNLGIICGYGGRFNPEAPISRQDAAVMLVRFMENCVGRPLTAVSKASAFADIGSVAGYAKPAVEALYQDDIIQGKGLNIFAPADPCTRGEGAKMIASLISALILK